jgi:hypothetical protein
MTTTEKNKLIAEFMGYEILNEYCDQFPTKEVDSLPMLEFMFSSWDELMPVIQKILEISLEMSSMEMYYNITDSIPNFENTYNACVEFILWYNQNKI